MNEFDIPRRPAFAATSCLLAWGLALLPAAFVHAKEDDKQLRPASPLVASPPEFGEWTVTPTTPPASANSSTASKREEPPKIIKKVYVRTGKTSSLQAHWDNGSKSETWIDDDYCFIIPPGQTRPVGFLKSERGMLEGEVEAFDRQFTGFEWLEISRFKNVEESNQKSCFHYLDPSTKREAWVDIKTNLPVAYKEDSILYVYQFFPRPTSSLTLPESVKKRLEGMKKYEARLKGL